MMSLLDFLEDIAFDGSLAELALWYPHLGWRQVALWVLTLVLWRIIFERFERVIAFYVRLGMARGLFRLAVAVKP